MWRRGKGKFALMKIQSDNEMERPRGVRPGFPSPAQDYMCDAIDMNEVLVRSPETTFYARMHSDVMAEAGIHEGDLLVIDKVLQPRDGDCVMAYLDGDFIVRRWHPDPPHQCAWLRPGNIRITADSDFVLWGVITFSITRISV